MKPDELIKQLQEYRTELIAIYSRFEKTRNRIKIVEADEPRLRIVINETVDLLNDCIGENKYSNTISQHFRSGTSNMYRSPSKKSVECIISDLTAAITRIKRNPSILGQKKNVATQNKNQNIEYPSKITLKWLWENVPAPFYWSLILAFAFFFSLGIMFAKTNLYKSLTETATAIISNGKKTTQINK